jgi:hypothetical protein
MKPKLTIKAKDLWLILSEDETSDAKLATKVKKLDIKQICVDFSMSEHNLGGDDVVRIVGEALYAIEQGYEIANWYGPRGLVLIIGFRKGELKIVE